MERDLLLVHYDCKTDVDDLQSVAAFATLIAVPKYSDLNYHAVAGTYGIQEGLYVPPNDLFELAFGSNWSDAHTDFDGAVKDVLALSIATLGRDGDIWIADGGQSDFSAAVVKAIQEIRPDIETTERVHIVQHSDWNEEVTSQEKLDYVKSHTHYQKIPDGNGLDNGTPGFKTNDSVPWQDFVRDVHIQQVWDLAIGLSNKYNGREGRYLNTAVEAGGLDFSDFAEVCWILGLDGMRNANDFFAKFGS